MSQVIEFIKDRISALINDESGQDGLEYLLVVGGISVAVVVAVATLPGIVPAIVSGTCDAVATITGYGAVTC